MKPAQRAQAYMRGAWHVSEVKDLEALKSKFKEIITVGQGAVHQGRVGPMVHEQAKRLGVEKTSTSSSPPEELLSVPRRK